jgi:DNA polymerase III subunit delta'
MVPVPPAETMVEAPDPRHQDKLFGHAEAEAALLNGFRSGRLHHAWLIGGPAGIGKATLAYRFVRYLLAAGAASETLAVDPSNRAARQIAALSHPNLMVLNASLLGTEKTPVRSIPVEAVRRVLAFFGSTAADSGYRICIVDSAEDLTTASANALLKAVEEPPPKSLFLIVSHAPRRVLATIRSRCRFLPLRPLSTPDVMDAVRSLGEPWNGTDAARLERAATLAEGSVGRTLDLLDGDRIGVIDEVTSMLDRLPAVDTKRMLALAEKLAPRGADAAYELALDTVQRWLSGAVASRIEGGAARLAPFAKVCEKLDDTAGAVDVYNLDRRPLFVSLFGDLADAVRRAG